MNRLRNTSLAAVAMLVLVGCGGGLNRYQGMEPGALFELATAEFEEGDHGTAITVLDRLLVGHGDWERLPEARMLLGDVYFDRGDYLTARSEYTRFLDRYAGHPSSVKASLGICQSLAALAPTPQRDQGYTQEAMSSCRNVVSDYTGLPESAEAAQISNELRILLAEKDYMNGDFYFRRKLWDPAIKYFEFVANLYPETSFAPRALLGLYFSQQAIGYDDLADEARDRLLSQYPDSEAAGSSEPMSQAADASDRDAVVTPRRVGVFGGTFDPPHAGHVAAARNVADALELDIVLWVPAHRSPHKLDDTLSPPQVRARMVQAATEEDPRFAMTSLELDREGPSYMVDTLRALAADPDFAGCQLFLIIGVDQYRAFDRWREPSRILDLATLVVMDRDGEGMAPTESITGDARPERVVRVRVPRVDVSSTEVRDRVRSGEDVHGRVSSPVATLITSEGLYPG